MTNKKIILIIVIAIFTITGIMVLLYPLVNNNIKELELNANMKVEIIPLPEPKFDSDVSIEEALLARRSVRSYTDEPLTLQEVSQLLWAAQGITVRPDGRKGRTAPSAGGLHPLEVYLTVRNVKGLEPGVYHFDPYEHNLRKVLVGNIHPELSDAALDQAWVAAAPINIVIGAVYERSTIRYGERGIRYVHMEVGHVGQNISLQVISLDLGTVVVGAFDDERVREIVNMAEDVAPLYIMPVGRPAPRR